MGDAIYAYIEYDDGLLYPGASSPTAFQQETDRVIDLTQNVGLSHGKDYIFMAALGSPRNPTTSKPLFGIRGLPPNTNWRIAKEFSDATNVSWLNLTDVEAALAHMTLRDTDLSFAAFTTIEIMRLLARRLGPDRVRLIFQIG